MRADRALDYLPRYCSVLGLPYTVEREARSRLPKVAAEGKGWPALHAAIALGWTVADQTHADSPTQQMIDSLAALVPISPSWLKNTLRS